LKTLLPTVTGYFFVSVFTNTDFKIIL